MDKPGIWIYVILFLSACFTGCKDQTFIQLPTHVLKSGQRYQADILQDSILIEDGLFFRQLSERQYSDIYGHALLRLPAGESGQNYQIVILSCRKNADRIGLTCSVDPDYYSIIDVMTYDMDSHKLISMQTSSMSNQMMDMRLLDISRLTRRPDTLLIQADNTGILEEFPLCCDF